MKTLKVMLYLLCGLLMVNTSVAGGKSKSKRKNTIAFDKAENALRSRGFVFHIDMFRLEGRQYSDANGGKNYLYIEGDSGVIVITTDMDKFYAEDVLVIDGKVSDVDFKVNKKGDLIYSAVITGVKGVAKFDIIVARDNNYATLKLNSNQIKGGIGKYLGPDNYGYQFKRDLMMANGKIVPASETSVVKKLPNADVMSRPNSIRSDDPYAPIRW